MTEWLRCLQNAYLAYISWEQLLANQERIQQNGLKFTKQRQRAQGIIRSDQGLLQGSRSGNLFYGVADHTASPNLVEKYVNRVRSEASGFITYKSTGS